MRYKFDRHRGLVDDFGNCILTLVPVGCSKKFRDMAGKELANKLNGIEQGKEAAVRREDMMRANMPILRAPSTRHINLSKCPKCGAPADNGHDREVPPNPYWCSKCSPHLD